MRSPQTIVPSSPTNVKPSSGPNHHGCVAPVEAELATFVVFIGGCAAAIAGDAAIPMGATVAVLAPLLLQLAAMAAYSRPSGAKRTCASRSAPGATLGGS